MPVKKLLDECRRLYNESKYMKVIRTCDEILDIDFNNERALGYKARCLNLLGKNDDALTLLNNALIMYPKNTYYLDLKADVFMDWEEYGKALDCYDKIFQIGVDDERNLDFLKRTYETCLSLRCDQLIEMEKYADAWKCYCLQLEMKSANPDKSEAIDSFKKHVRQYSPLIKSRHYYVKISSDEGKLKLIRFLKENGFESKHEAGLLFSIDVVDKTYNSVSVDKVGDADIISESKFYDKINYCPWDKIVYKRIFDEYGNLLYEGNTLHNAPYGFGTAYFENGNVYREGIFDIKGIVQGKEYYPSGQLRFEGQWSLTRGYGPNAPYDGNAYGENGELIYSGKFEIKRGGVGWPMIQKPKGFPREQKHCPKINYL